MTATESEGTCGDERRGSGTLLQQDRLLITWRSILNVDKEAHRLVPDTPHFILTRFNVLKKKQTQSDAPGLDWLTHRFDLFEKFCLPSVLAQDEPSFRWLIYFDKETPPQFKARVRGYADSRIVPRFVPPGGATLDKVKQHIRSELCEKNAWILTTRLDNDDALACDFCSELRRNVTSLEPQALNFTQGLIYADGRLFQHSDRSNAFISALEPTSNFETAWHGYHTEVSKFLPVKQIAGQPMWMQVVHGRNISNVVRGQILENFEEINRFNVNLPDLQAPNKITKFIDQAVFSIYRRSRDKIIHTLKTVTSPNR